MEAASVPADGAVEGQEPEQGAEQQEGQQQGPDLSPVFERLDQMGQSLTSELDQRFAALQPQEEPAPDPLAEDLQRLAGDDVDPQQARSIFNRAVQEAAQEMIAPVAQDVQQMRMEAKVEKLFEEFPELKDEKKMEGVWNDAFELAMDVTGGDQEQAEWLANQPSIIRTAYLAGVARQRAEGEQAPADREVDLESAGAAVPGQADYDDLRRQGIRNAGGERNELLLG